MSVASSLSPAIPAVFRIDRKSPALSTEAPEHVANHISALLRKQLEQLTADGNTASVPPRDGLSRFAPAAQPKIHVAERIRKQLLPSVPRAMDLTIPVGSRVIAPPYDQGWNVGAAGPLPRWDGSMFIIGGDGFSADGVAIDLSSNTQLLVSVTPMGTYDFSWFAFDHYPQLLSQGGLGVLVYQAGESVPILVRQAVLWTLNGVSQFTGNKGSGLFKDAVSSTDGFGPVRLAPILFNMSPGTNYQVWMWCWMVGQNESGTSFLSVVDCHIPSVLVDAGPPIVIH